MATQQNAVINGTLQLTGSIAGGATLASQSIGGGLVIYLPNSAPIGTGQLLSVAGINGDQVVLGFANPTSLTNIPLTALQQSGATNGQVIEWNGSAWVPGSVSGGNPSGAAGTIQWNNSGAFAGATNSSVSGTGAVVIGNVANGSPVSTTALTVSASGGIAISAQDWYSSNEGTIVASMKTSGLLNVNGISISSSVSIGGLPALAVTGGNAGSPDIADFTTASGATPSSTKTVWIDYNGNLNLVGGFKDHTGSLGTSGQLLSSTGTATTWISQSALSIAYSQVTGTPNLALYATLAGNPTFSAGITVEGANVQAPGINSLGSGFTVLDSSSQGLTIVEDGTGGIGVTCNGAGGVTITGGSGGSYLSGSVSGKGVLVNASLATDGVVLWDNTGSNYIGVTATGGGVQIQTSGGGTIALSGGAVTVAPGTAAVGLKITGIGTGDLQQWYVNSTAAISVSSHGHLVAGLAGGATNADMAGTVTMTNPASTAAVGFNFAYTGTNAPTVALTAVGADPTALGGVWVTYQGSAGAWTGFTVNVTTPPAASATWNYQVIGQS
jgi:hypothetical protein